MNDPQHRLITSRIEFQDALRESFAGAAREGCRTLWLVDEDFADWPLSERSVIEDLTQWALPHRKLVLIARQFDDIVRRHARWIEWRRQWTHVVECLAFEDAEQGAIPTLLLAEDLVAMRLFDAIHHRGAVSREPSDCIRYRELVDAVSQRAVPSFPSTVLGL